jgi:hypothetical protein
MMVSPGQDALFIHIQKTAGSSLTKVLEAHGWRQVLGTHDGVRAASALPGFERMFRFAFVRNPWERLVSWWAMIDASRRRLTNRFGRYVQRTASTFDEFVERCTDVIEDNDGTKCAAWPQLDYLSDDRGRLAVDFVGRFEHLDRDVAAALSRLSLPAEVLPHINATPHLPYPAYYTARTRQIVADRFAVDLAHFGYTFEGEPGGGV